MAFLTCAKNISKIKFILMNTISYQENLNCKKLFFSFLEKCHLHPTSLAGQKKKENPLPNQRFFFYRYHHQEEAFELKKLAD